MDIRPLSPEEVQKIITALSERTPHFVSESEKVQKAAAMLDLSEADIIKLMGKHTTIRAGGASDAIVAKRKCD